MIALVFAFIAIFVTLRLWPVLRPVSRRPDWQGFLAIFPRKNGSQSSGWLVYLYRQRVSGKWDYRYY